MGGNCWYTRGTCGHVRIYSYSLPKKCKDNKNKITHFMRKDLGKHLKSNCPERAYRCKLKYCGKKGTYAHITQVHVNTCERKIVTCPNAGCYKTMQRKNVERHNERCVYAEIPCPKECKDKNEIAHFMRKDLGKHLKNFCPNRKIIVERRVPMLI